MKSNINDPEPVKNVPVSFEFYPTKTEQGAIKLERNALLLAQYKPEFFSVTYGAGGSTRDRTLETVLATQEHTCIATVPHLSCVGDSKAQLKQLLNLYMDQGINRIVALRGDLPSGMGRGLGELNYASDLVEFIRLETGDYFHIEVAAYPEVHPQSISMEKDLLHFKQKIAAGADSAITQYFFNADSYFYYLDRVQAMGIDVQVVPGIMPITNYFRLARFSDACGAEIPRWMRKQLEAYGDDIDSICKFGEEVVSGLCEKLLAGGAPGLHFYTLNQAGPCQAICDNMGWNKSSPITLL